MTRPTRIEKNCTTGEEIVHELTDDEIAQIEANRAAWQAEREAQEAAATTLANLKASAKAKLIAGEPLTAEEADTLVL